MGSARDLSIAIPLAVAGAASAVGLISGSLGLRRSGSGVVREIAAALGVLVSFALGAVSLIFAFSFHW
jgi:hypothetical protein